MKPLSTIYILIFLIFCAGLVSAAVNVTVSDPNGGEVFSQKDGNYSIDFNAMTTATPYNLSAYIYYSATQGNRENAIVTALTLDGSVCDDANLEDSTHCSWDWNSAAMSAVRWLASPRTIPLRWRCSSAASTAKKSPPLTQSRMIHWPNANGWNTKRAGNNKSWMKISSPPWSMACLQPAAWAWASTASV